MIRTQPLANFRHRVVELSSNNEVELNEERQRYIANGYTLRHGTYRAFGLFCVMVEKLDQENLDYDSSWRPGNE